MQIQQQIRSSANVIRVTNIAAGDVYKRFDSTYDDRVYYGVVKNVHNDGEKAIVEAVEYGKHYGNLEINLKVLRGEKDYNLFPADPSELDKELGDVIGKKEREIEKKHEEIRKLEAEVAEVRRLISGETLTDLKAMSYVELSQKAFEAKKLEAAESFI